MPNGTMSGDGTQGSPFIVMDGYDFNALRDIVTSVSDFKYIELGADIDLSVYAIFTPIAEKHFNIDGKGHLITGINIAATGYEAGLFLILSVNAYIKDLTIEGEISVNAGGSLSAGALCGHLYLLTDAVISNVEAYFTLSFSTSSRPTVGGLIGVINPDGRGNSAISECAFKGTMVVSSSSTSTSTSTLMVIGGLFGQLYSGNPNEEDMFLIDKCITEVNYRINCRLNMRMGGIFGDLNQPYNTSSDCFLQVMVSKCVAKSTVQFTHTAAVASNTHRLAGIVCIPGYYTSQVTTVEKCVAFMDVHWTHQQPLFAFRMAGLLFSGTSSSQRFKVNQSYAVMRMLNPDNLPWTGCSENLGSVTYLPSSSPTVQVTEAFFDKEVFAAHYDGVFTETHGVTTAELKSVSFLTQRGWEFEDE